MTNEFSVSLLNLTLLGITLFLYSNLQTSSQRGENMGARALHCAQAGKSNSRLKATYTLDTNWVIAGCELENSIYDKVRNQHKAIARMASIVH
jgi:hypothetical protein